MTLRSGCEAWQETLRGSQNEMMIQTMDMTEGMITCSGGAKVEEDIGG